MGEGYAVSLGKKDDSFAVAATRVRPGIRQPDWFVFDGRRAPQPAHEPDELGCHAGSSTHHATARSRLIRGPVRRRGHDERKTRDKQWYRTTLTSTHPSKKGRGGQPRTLGGGVHMEKWEESSYRRHVRRIRHKRRIMRFLMRRAIRWYPGPDPCSRDLQTWSDVEKGRREYVRQHYGSRKLCRCFQCMNARRGYGCMTPQEWRAYLDAREQSEEAGVRVRPARFRDHC